jgi:hypothetical protein
MRVIDNLDDLYFEVDTSHRPKIGTTVYKVVLLENAKRFVELEKVIAERRGRVEELKVWETMLDDTILADETDGVVACKDLYVIRERMQNRLLKLEKGDLK